MYKKIFIILFGIIIAFIIKFFILIEYRGPNSSIIKNIIYKKDNLCYKLEPQVYICPK